MTSIQPRAGLYLAALAAALCTSAAAAQDTTRDSAVPSATSPAASPATTGRARREAPAVPARRSSRTRLEADVIVPWTLSYRDAHALIAALRPHWLSSRSQSSTVRVYHDRVLMGGTEALRSIPLHSVQRIEWLNGNEASSRFGQSHAGGAILVTTR